MMDGRDTLKSGFFITPIGADGSPERARADELLDFVLTPLLTDMGYRITRGDRDPDPGQILEAVLAQIISADLVVADITGRNPNVFYELAVAHAARRPTVMIQEGDERLPFDVANLRAIPYNISLPSGTDALRAALRAAIESVESGGPLRSPLQGHFFSPETQAIEQMQSDPVAFEMGALRDEVRALGAELRRQQHPSSREAPSGPDYGSEAWADFADLMAQLSPGDRSAVALLLVDDVLDGLPPLRAVERFPDQDDKRTRAAFARVAADIDKLVMSRRYRPMNSAASRNSAVSRIMALDLIQRGLADWGLRMERPEVDPHARQADAESLRRT